jgi:hypothetical protein
MSPSMSCPKCAADISESYEPDDWSVGISAGWFCDACDLAIGDDGHYEPTEGDVPVVAAKEFRGDKPLGTPISELSGQPGPKDDIGHPDHARYAEFCRIARSWGYD